MTSAPRILTPMTWTAAEAEHPGPQPLKPALRTALCCLSLVCAGEGAGGGGTGKAGSSFRERPYGNSPPEREPCLPRIVLSHGSGLSPPGEETIVAGGAALGQGAQGEAQAGAQCRAAAGS